METWALTKSQKKFAEMKYMQLIRLAFGKKGYFTMRNRESNEAILNRTGLMNFEMIHALKKLRWVSHVLREDYQLLKDDMQKSKQDEDAWWKTYIEAIGAVQMNHEFVVEKTDGPVNWEKMIEERRSKPNGDNTNKETIELEDKLENESFASGMTD